MSSPLSSLGRNRRVPLPEFPSPGGAVPFKQSSSMEDEDVLFNSILSSTPSMKLQPESASTSQSKQTAVPKGSAPSDLELMSTMMQKLTLMEQRLRSQAQEIHKKDRKIAVLEEKIKILQKNKDEFSESRRVKELEVECLQLQYRVWEMERFLNDYGMIWVGDKRELLRESELLEETPGTECETQLPRRLWKPGRSVTFKFQVDFDLILENVRDLNILAGEGEFKVEHREGGARLRQTDPIPLTLYKNGIVMFCGPFRSYEEPSTQQCLQDIMDGYFPTELQRRYPEGIPLQVTDRRDVTFRESHRWDTFPGQGQKVGGSQPIDGSSQETSELPGPKLTMEQFLNKLPRAVIQDGKVLDIRGPIQEALRGTGGTQKSSIVLVETPSLTAMKERLEMDEENRPPSASNISTLRIKSESGDQTYIVKMHFSETIADLRKYLAQHRGTDSNSYDIISTFPQREYSDNSKTLQEYGLIPNATLLLRPKRT
ncbi:UBX domain-containing protein 11 isoform X2 [Rhinatrema bivittatum]|uniref:UBX domain-containing protein 11 isoform X2 n=1 Tax=Rhinatrema bivittatum TaxID=194408 RepID=UPI0011270D51|nr:UBX domain-containing protein 11 isoform X2 [Rhinatrema bivittatum]